MVVVGRLRVRQIVLTIVLSVLVRTEDPLVLFAASLFWLSSRYLFSFRLWVMLVRVWVPIMVVWHPVNRFLVMLGRL